MIKPNLLRLMRANKKQVSNFPKSRIEKGEQMNEELLTRLVDALEGINSNLSDIAVSLDSMEKNLDGCVSVNGNNRFLCITGNVSTY